MGVVRLELPDDRTTKQNGGVRLDDGIARTVQRPDSRPRPALDPIRLARAVEDLIRAIDPTLVGARVEVEVTAPGALFSADADEQSDRTSDGQTDRTSDEEPELELDLARRTLSVDGQAVNLTRREFELLAYLHDHRGVALSREELMRTVWHSISAAGGRTIDVHIRRLRMKLGRHAGRLGTLRGYGYRLD